jgi:hypothetical protein
LKSNLLSLGLFREGGLGWSSLAGKIDRPDCLAARDGIWGNIEKVGDCLRGDSGAVSAGGGAGVGVGTEASLLTIGACSDLGPARDPSGVGTINALLMLSSGNVILGRYDVGLGDTGVEGLVKCTSSGLTQPSGFPESEQGVTLLLLRGAGNGGI